MTGSRSLKLIAIVGALLLVNWLASVLHFRVDLTEDRRYSLSGVTRAMADSISGRLSISVFLEGDLPVEFRRLSLATEDFLATLREANPEAVNYRFVSPQDEAPGGKPWADTLVKIGADPINVSIQQEAGEETRVLFPYARMEYDGRVALVNLFPSSKRFPTVAELHNAEAMLEYQFVREMDRLLHSEVSNVAYAVGHGQPVGAETYDLQQTIGGRYNLGLLNLKEQPAVPPQVDVMLMVKPAEKFSDDDKLKLDQFVMRGGKMLWFVDNLFAEQDSLSIKSHLIAYERGLNLEDLFFNYGVRLNPDLIMDLQSDFLPFAVGGSRSNPQYEFLHWNYYPLFESANNHSINKNLGLVAGRYVNSIDTVEKEGVQKTFLLQSSSNARTISTPAVISPNENRNTPQDVLFKQRDIPAAVLLEGRFTSLFRNRIGRAQLDSLKQFGGFRQVVDNNAMIVVADGDLVLNDVSPQQGPLPMGVNYFTAGTQYEYQFANRDFLLNCLEYLTSDASLVAVRNKEIVMRMLDVKKVQDGKLRWQLLTIALPVVLLLLAGWGYLQLRNKKYTQGWQ